jgi:hypothetical protein
MATTDAKAMLKRLRSFYKLGVESRDSDRSVRLFAESRGVKPATVWKARAFADKYTPRQLESLCRTTRENGLPLHWGYVCFLVTVEDPDVRQELVECVQENNWTAPELHAEIKRRFPGRGNVGAGRKRKVPKSTTDRLRMIANDAAAWARRCEWFTDKLLEPPLKPLRKKETKLKTEALKALGSICAEVERLSGRLSKLQSKRGK